MSGAAQVLAQHAVFAGIGARVIAQKREGEWGPIHRLKWHFVERQGAQSYAAFSEAVGLQTEPADLIALVRTLAGERSTFASELKRPNVYKTLQLRYQPDDARWPFWLAARLRDGERQFQGHTGLSEYDALKIMWCATTVLAADVGASPRVMLDYALRVGARGEARQGDEDEPGQHNARGAVADAG